MEQEPRQERPEIYERIPWETLEQKKPDRQWLMFGIGGAIVFGVLAYSFIGDRPVQTAPPVSVVAEASPSVSIPLSVPPPTVLAPMAPTAPPESPVVVSEADLFAVHPERVVDQAVAHAEWFIAEYFTADGSEEHSAVLKALLPAGIPLPDVPDGTSVFVESVVSTAVVEKTDLNFVVDVVVRYLVARGGEAYRRQEPVLATVGIVVSDAGPQVAGPPTLSQVSLAAPAQLRLVEIPPDVAGQVMNRGDVAEILGGIPVEGGSWSVVALVLGPDGVTRPVSIPVG
jgi:hypothetical protein